MDTHFVVLKNRDSRTVYRFEDRETFVEFTKGIMEAEIELAVEGKELKVKVKRTVDVTVEPLVLPSDRREIPDPPLMKEEE